jgi:hypothetical protein
MWSKYDRKLCNRFVLKIFGDGDYKYLIPLKSHKIMILLRLQNTLFL